MFMLEIKICIKNIGVQHSLEKIKLQLCFFLKKPFLVMNVMPSSKTRNYNNVFSQRPF